MGRRGRVAFTARWGPIQSRQSSRLESMPTSGDGDNGATSVCEREHEIVDETASGAVLSYVNKTKRSREVEKPTPLHSGVREDHRRIEFERVNQDSESAGNESNNDLREEVRHSTSNTVAHVDNEDMVDIPEVVDDCMECGNEGYNDIASEDEVTPPVRPEDLPPEDNEGHADIAGGMDGTAPVDEAVGPLESVDYADNRGPLRRHGCQTRSLSRISAGVRKISMWQNLMSVVLVTGSVRLSVQEFDIFRKCINTLLEKGFPDEKKLPAYSTVDRTLLPIARSLGFARSETTTAEMDFTKAGTKRRELGRQQLGCSRVVKPSEWSSIDVSSPQTWGMLKDASRRGQITSETMQFETIDSVPMVRRRESVLNTLARIKAPLVEELCNPHSADCTSGTAHEYMWNLIVKKNSSFPMDLRSMMEISMQGNDEMSMLLMTPIRTVLIIRSKTNSDIRTARPKVILDGNLPQLRTEVLGKWHAGDYCTAMRAESDVQYLLVVAHHQAHTARLSRRLELICVPYSVRRTGGGSSCLLEWDKCRKIPISDLKLATRRSVSAGPSLPLYQTNGPVIPSYGRLRSGQRYFVDRILLYSDGFSQYQPKQGSAGGIYCLSLNYSPHLRRTRERVRVLALTPPGISTSEGLRAAIADLVTSATEGVTVRNADGEDMILFIDVVGYVCDYCEVGHVLDVMGHNAKAPCHLCSFLRFKGHESASSQYCSTTSTHSGDACYARTGPRTEALRQSAISDEMLATIGLKRRDNAGAQRSPLFEYYKMLTERLRRVTIPQTEFHRPVVNPRFDPYRSVFVAPDHLLAGIPINEMNLAFRALPTNSRRKQADFLICQQLQWNGLCQESEVFNFSSSALHTTSISSTFCILLIAAPVLSEVVADLSSPDEMEDDELQFFRRIFKNMSLFRKLVSKIYWYPRRHVDSPQSIVAFNRHEGMDHISALQNICAEYITECNEICKRSTLATSELDKPNVHRLLELYNYSIPAMGHVHHFADSLFECAHQPLKRAMKESNFNNTHLQSMTHCVADNWKDRLTAAFDDRDDSNDARMASVPNILCGRQQHIRAFVSQDQVLKEGVAALSRNDMMRSMIGTIPTHMECRQAITKWRLSDRSAKQEMTMNALKLRAAVMEVIIRDLIGTDHTGIEWFDKAGRIKVWGSGNSETRSHSRAHDTLTQGNMVQVLLSDEFSGVLSPLQNGFTEGRCMLSTQYFAIEVLFEDSDKVAYAAVRNCIVTNEVFLRVQKDSSLQLRRLNDRVRRDCIVHACHGDPKLSCIGPDRGAVNCNASILNGNLYYFYNRENGYPSRMT